MNTARREESRSDIFCRIGDRHTHACRDLLQRLAQRLRAHRQLDGTTTADYSGGPRWVAAGMLAPPRFSPVTRKTNRRETATAWSANRS